MRHFGKATQDQPSLSAALMQAHVFRKSMDYDRAIDCTKSALRLLRDDDRHYGLVFLGNLYYERAMHARGQDRDQGLFKALYTFNETLKRDKDSQYAVNGVGMVFAARGNRSVAKRIFQSVIEHHSMSQDPSVHINLGHIYVAEEQYKKAVRFYEAARKLRGDDRNLWLSLARAHYCDKSYDHAVEVLSEALMIWPYDLLVRYNLATTLEGYGAHLLNSELLGETLAGLTNEQQISRAVDMLKSAKRIFKQLGQQWAESRAQCVEALGGQGACSWSGWR